MSSSSILGCVLVAYVFVHISEQYEVINENGCSKVLRRQHKVLTEAKKDDVSNVRGQICYETPSSIYYCPGDGICCTPGSPTSKCCPADHPLCVDDGCCPIGYPKVCGQYCCKEDSYCCGENCCIDEQSCCGEDQCCTQENPCCKNGEVNVCCNKYSMACCGEEYGCVEPCESQFDAIGCILLALNDDLEIRRLTSSVSGPWKTLYRILRPNEIAKALLAKNPLADKTVISHVNCGSRAKYASQYISTTASLDVAKYYKEKGEEKGLTGLRIAKIDVSKLPVSTVIYDLTTDENRDKYIGLGPIVCKNFAKKSQEVLLVSKEPIPSEVIEEFSQSDDLNSKNEL